MCLRPYDLDPVSVLCIEKELFGSLLFPMLVCIIRN